MCWFNILPCGTDAFARPAGVGAMHCRVWLIRFRGVQADGVCRQTVGALPVVEVFLHEVVMAGGVKP